MGRGGVLCAGGTVPACTWSGVWGEHGAWRAAQFTVAKAAPRLSGSLQYLTCMTCPYSVTTVPVPVLAVTAHAGAPARRA